MASSNLNLHFTIKELIAGAEQLSTNDLEKFFETFCKYVPKGGRPISRTGKPSYWKNQQPFDGRTAEPF